MDTLTLAEATHRDLSHKLDAARSALASIAEQRSELAFDAHVKGGSKKAALDWLNQDRLLRQAEVEDLETAIRQAERLIEDARRAEEDAADAVKATRALQIADEVAALGLQFDAALAMLSEASNSYTKLLEELNYKLGVSHPSHAQMKSAMDRALRAVLIFTPMRECIEFIAPGERKGMNEIALKHAEAIRRAAEARLPAEAAE
jgi:hypothetical protein